MGRMMVPIVALVLGAASPAKIDMAPRMLPPAAVAGETVRPFVKLSSGKLALVHVRVIDGTGAAAQTVRR